jgi:phage terminase small subunit
MGDNDRLSTSKRRIIAALATTSTVRDAARVAGVGETTAYRYLSDPVVKAELAHRQDAMLAQVCAGIVEDMSEARRVLRGLLDAEEATDSVKVRAASKLLDAGLRLLELVALSDRVSELERLVINDNQK